MALISTISILADSNRDFARLIVEPKKKCKADYRSLRIVWLSICLAAMIHYGSAACLTGGGLFFRKPFNAIVLINPDKGIIEVRKLLLFFIY